MITGRNKEGKFDGYPEINLNNDPTFRDVVNEMIIARNRFPPFHSYHEGLTVICEEF